MERIKGIAAELIADLTPDEIDDVIGYLQFGALGARVQQERANTTDKWPPNPKPEATPVAAPAKAKRGKATESLPVEEPPSDDPQDF